VAVVVVEQPEVVDVDEGDAERQAGRPGTLDLVRQVLDWFGELRSRMGGGR
jgi:hypothetical protein